MDINKKNRSDLKSYFVKNSIPTESNFAELIDGMLNQKDDGIVKLSGDPLSIEAAGDLAGLQKVINFYAKFQDANPAWSLQLNPRTDSNKPETAKAGFCVVDGGGNARLFIDRDSGYIGVGVVNPSSKLDVAGQIRLGLDEGGSGIRTVSFARDAGDEVNAGKISYRGGFSADSLNIVGAGVPGAARKIKLWDNVEVVASLTVGGIVNANSGVNATTVNASGVITANAGVNATVVNASGVITANAGVNATVVNASGVITANAGVNATVVKASGLITANAGIAVSGNTVLNGAVTLGGFTGADADEWPKLTWYRDTANNWDEGLIKHDHTKGLFGRTGFGIHIHASRDWTFFSTGWDALFGIEGGTGNTKIKGNLTVNGAITPSNGNSASNGVAFKNNVNGDTTDSAWMRYYPRSGELMTLEIGTANDNTDHIALMPSGNVGIGINNPGAKLDVEGTAFLGYANQITDFGVPLKSGFYQGVDNIIGDVPDASHPWTHLITSRHFNLGNNHQLQIASTFMPNDKLYFRKIADNGTSNPAWNEVATRGVNVFSGNQSFTNGNIGIGTSNLNYSLDVSASKGIKLGLEGNGGGQLILTNNPGDNKIYLEAFSKDGTGSAAEILLTGKDSASVQKISLLANNTYIGGDVTINGKVTCDDNPLSSTQYTIELCGSAFESTEGNITFLKVNDVSMGMSATRGLNTVILNSGGTVKITANHDVYANAATWDTWAAWVNANSGFGDVVAVASYDAISNAPRGGAAELLLASILADQAFVVSNTNQRSPYALLFMVGGNAVEVAQPYKGTNAHLKRVSNTLVPTPNAWRNVRLINGWVNFGSGYNPPQFFKDNDGVIWLRGLVKAGVLGKTLFVLPEGSRPSYRQLHSICAAENVLGRIDVTADGQVIHVTGGTNVWLSLDSMAFRAAPKPVIFRAIPVGG